MGKKEKYAKRIRKGERENIKKQKLESEWTREELIDQLIEKVQRRRFTKVIKNMEEKTYEERLHCLRLWSLEERSNRQDLIEVFKICNGLSRLKLNELSL